MEGDWPIFKLCNDAWKLEYLACTAYPGWKRAHLDNNGKLKKKVNDKEDNDSDCSHDDDGNESHHEDKGNTGPGHSSTKSKKTKKRKLSKVKSEIPAKKAKVDEAQGKTATENKNDGLVVNNSQVVDNTPMPQMDETTTSRLPKQNDNTPPAMQRLNNTSTNSNDTALPESNVNGNSGNLVNNPKPVEASMANTSILANSRSSESDKENIDPAEGNKPKGKKTVKLVIKNPLSLSSLTTANIDMPERPPLPLPRHQNMKSLDHLRKMPKSPKEGCVCPLNNAGGIYVVDAGSNR
ncbi:hypothetical protein PAXINDRAFT_21325 [Paxillus involutus ATCC 200175]|uniref:Uncharacterized protein n=1 Tax=Paxillus involutus ATCC 200175 TaxID=664439 RepID=A0A0C9STF4_PAXIN|nr:hypothetical protein PAXINDRAFT_21325 [Paxillus involutus ATCC 200175]